MPAGSEKLEPSPRDSARRLAFVVSHPIQYYVPLYRALASRADPRIKVFYTWHAGQAQVYDRGFERAVAWDIPLTDGYEYEMVPNTAADPGTHHFLGLRNPTLVASLLAWRPDAVHVTGYAAYSHLFAIRALRRRGIAVLFRGDSHLLDEDRRGLAWQAKRTLLRTVYSWPSICLYAGTANKAYYEAFGVKGERLRYCPHSIDVGRFAEPHHELEREARAWRRRLDIGDDSTVLVYAGKFEARKRPLELMRAVRQAALPDVILVMLGAGPLERGVHELALADPRRFRVLPFQNQSRMPVAYRLGEVFVLPSAYGETWGLAVNEAMACRRPVIVSDRVGCAPDLVRADRGWVFPADDWAALIAAIGAACDPEARRRRGAAAAAFASSFDVAAAERALMAALSDLPASVAAGRRSCPVERLDEH